MYVRVTNLRKVGEDWEFLLHRETNFGNASRFRLDARGNLHKFIETVGEWRQYNKAKIRGLDDLKTNRGREKRIVSFFAGM